MSSTLLALDAVGAVLGGLRVLSDITARIAPGERIALVGPNGAGKSTLLRRMAGLVAGPGQITLDGQALESLSRVERARRIAFLPQGHDIAWPIPVADLVMLGRLPHGADLARPSQDDRRACDRAMQRLRIDGWRTRAATTLSHGEQARVLLARALATEAPLLLADEPVAALDPAHQIGVLDTLAAEAAQGASVMVVLHDLGLAAQWASRILLLGGGRLIHDGPPAETLTASRISTTYAVCARRHSVEGGFSFTYTGPPDDGHSAQSASEGRGRAGGVGER